MRVDQIPRCARNDMLAIPLCPSDISPVNGGTLALLDSGESRNDMLGACPLCRHTPITAFAPLSFCERGNAEMFIKACKTVRDWGKIGCH